jgi:hypothetical protein
VEDLALNTQQLQFLLQKTPKKYIKSRPAKGGGTWNYVSGAYIKKVLNLVFGWDWDFEVITSNYYPEAKQVIVLGKLTVRSNGRQLVKMQYGRKDVICKKGTDTPLDLGNDFKAATTDALKKCANELGIAEDVYAPEEFKEVEVIDDELPELTPEMPEWKVAIERGYTVNQLKKKYFLTPENINKYEKEANNG